jgi:hypothetical protein
MISMWLCGLSFFWLKYPFQDRRGIRFALYLISESVYLVFLFLATKIAKGRKEISPRRPQRKKNLGT